MGKQFLLNGSSISVTVVSILQVFIIIYNIYYLKDNLDGDNHVTKGLQTQA